MAILRGAAKNVFNLLRRREHPVRVQDSDHHPDDPVLSPTLVHTLTGVYLFVSFLPDSQHFIGGCCDGTVRKWQVTDGREVGKVMNHGSLVTAIAMSEDGKAIASGGVDGKVVIWSTDTCENLVESPEEHSDWVTSLSFAPNLQTVASGSRDGSIIVWSATTGKRVTGPLGGSKDSVDFLSFSPAGDKIASCGYFGDVQIWDSSLGERILKIPALASVCWSHDGSQFICGSFNGTIEFFDSSSGAHLATCRGHEHLVTSIAVSQDGTWLASASFDDHTVRLWSTSTHQQLASLDHSGQVFGVSISPNDTYIASGGYNKINIWRLPNVNATLQKGKGDPAASRPFSISSCEQG
ncbi:quinon protein alcohol dehydrogenase-like superfamily [Phlebopus sp. FC_14]|nr:quinon protein alcohol dehydrogenase-like superfamily [Phlebopus sp. FC_14]